MKLQVIYIYIPEPILMHLGFIKRAESESLSAVLVSPMVKSWPLTIIDLSSDSKAFPLKIMKSTN